MSLIVGITVHYLSVHLIYKYFVWSNLRSNMKDQRLEFWTSPPSVFLVATTVSGKVIGCIAYRQTSSVTVQMHRLAVDSEYRGQNIGQKLVQALLNSAWSNGYDSMYLETTSAQIGAIKLYEKMEFKYLHNVPFGPFPWL